jgi:hypothetical protein
MRRSGVVCENLRGGDLAGIAIGGVLASTDGAIVPADGGASTAISFAIDRLDQFPHLLVRRHLPHSCPGEFRYDVSINVTSSMLIMAMGPDYVFLRTTGCDRGTR